MIRASREIHMEEIMENEMFVGVETVAKDFGVSKGFAYKLIKQMNEVFLISF